MNINYLESFSSIQIFHM